LDEKMILLEPLVSLMPDATNFCTAMLFKHIWCNFDEQMLPLELLVSLMHDVFVALHCFPQRFWFNFDEKMIPLALQQVRKLWGNQCCSKHLDHQALCGHLINSHSELIIKFLGSPVSEQIVGIIISSELN
jgi:hypothetical protein